MSTVIKIEHLWKEYRLGVISHGTLTHDLQSWWAKVRGTDDPNRKISEKTGKPVPAGYRKRFWALSDVNLDVEQGRVLGIIGKNGAGKSTLLKVLSRVTAPTRGSIKVKGRIASLLEVGTGFHPELTGRENIFLNGAILGMSKGEVNSKLDEIIDFSGVEEFVDTPVKRYSSGMYVRLAFSVAAHLEPEILIVDEVLAVGDVSFQKKCLGKMGEVSREGRTILFVSHNLGAVANLCDSAVLMQNGAVVSQGDVSKTLDKYIEESIALQDLKDVKGRKGSGRIRFTYVKVYSNKDTEDIKITTGKPFYIELGFEGSLEDLQSGRIDVGIDDLFGNRLFWFSTSEHKDVEVTEGRVVFGINKMPLNEGSYYVTLYSEVEGYVSDWIKQSFSFAVENIVQSNTDVHQKNKPRFLVDYSME